VDTSALGSAYLGDEADASWIADVVFGGSDPVVICELADVEIASLFRRARRDGRIDDQGVAERLDAYQDHTAARGPIAVVPLTHATFVRARHFVLKTTVRTLDALHLAAAQLLAEASDEEMTILTRDALQASAATALGFSLYPVPEGRV
jgi:predicted nucleic acid-binding protein